MELSPFDPDTTRRGMNFENDEEKKLPITDADSSEQAVTIHSPTGSMRDVTAQDRALATSQIAIETLAERERRDANWRKWYNHDNKSRFICGIGTLSFGVGIFLWNVYEINEAKNKMALIGKVLTCFGIAAAACACGQMDGYNDGERDFKAH